MSIHASCSPFLAFGRPSSTSQNRKVIHQERIVHSVGARAVVVSSDPSGTVRCGKITLWLCQNSYWKWPFIVDFPIKNGDFHSYVSLPEGNHECRSLSKKLEMFHWSIDVGKCQMGIAILNHRDGMDVSKLQNLGKMFTCWDEFTGYFTDYPLVI